MKKMGPDLLAPARMSWKIQNQIMVFASNNIMELA